MRKEKKGYFFRLILEKIPEKHQVPKKKDYYFFLCNSHQQSKLNTS